jgi:3-phenylpropionate/trans-cinnamate dioxygenase ferredoxin reductase component
MLPHGAPPAAQRQPLATARSVGLMRIDNAYVIVGGGVAADAAARGIREIDPSGSIAILGEEADPPYDRPPLSKDLWRDPAGHEPFLGTDGATDAQLHLSTRATGLDRAVRTVTAGDDAYGYRTLLLATGGRPRELNLGPSTQVVYFRTIGDYHRARAMAGRDVVVVGGGFIGTELAAGLTMAGSRVTFLVSDDEVGARQYPPGLARRIRQAFDDRGVDVRTDTRARWLERSAVGTVTVHAETGTTPVSFAADGVVLGLGIEPNVELAQASGLPVENGVVVDRFLRTVDPAVFAAGDAASYPDAILGRRRVEHVDQASVSGRAAGRAMAAHVTGRALEPYTHTPFFYSDIFDLGYEAVGTLDTRLTMLEDWAEPEETGVVYYVDRGALVGVLLWNVWDSTDQARALLSRYHEAGSLPDPSVLKGAIAAG